MKKVVIIIFLIAINFLSKAAVIYTDIVDVTMAKSGNQYDLDLDQNAVIDFKINLTFPQAKNHNQVTLIHQSTNRGGVKSVIDWLGKLAWNLNVNDTITSKLASWKTSGANTPNEIFLAYYAGNSMKGGTFLNEEGYLPLEFIIGSNTHYGWVRVGVNANCTEFTVKDFAYEDTPGKAIVAGSKFSVGVNETASSKFNVFPNPTSGLLNIETLNNYVIKQIDIFSLQGKLLSSIDEISNVVNLSKYDRGQYLFTFHFQDNAIETRKITIN